MYCGKMLDTKDENGVTKMLDSDCKICVQESQKLLEPKKLRNSQILIEFRNLCYSVHDRKGSEEVILNDVTGHFESGKVTMIIGPSGAGKTTLLKILSGKRSVDIKGNITMNGIKWNRNIFRKQMCYVPQQFDLLPFLTTRETLYVAARLKLDIDQKKDAIYLIVNEIADKLSLSKCLDTLAYKLSGGERKRLSIGVELINNPFVLLLDEPTSGLDSAASKQVINILHNMARENCTVVCSIHQPSSQMISLVDNIMVLNQGKCMYCGPRNEILNTYSIAGFTCPNFYNIAEFVLEVITEQRDGDLENLYKICREKYEQSSLSNKRNKNELDLSTYSKQEFLTDNTDKFINNIVQEKSTWQQQKILFLRSLICIKRDNTLTKLRFAAHVVVALLLGIVFYNFGNDAEKADSNIACLFFFLLFLFFANSLPAVQMFPTEATVFLQEHLNNWYSLRSYYSVKIFTDLPMQILCASSFLFISYYITGQPMECDRILQAWSVCLLITILGQTVGILTGAVFNTEIGTFLIPAMSIPLLLFAGFFLKLGEISKYLQPLGVVSFFRYAFEGMMQAVYLDRPNLTCLEIYCYLSSPNKILSKMSMPTVIFPVILIILGSWILCLHVITYAVLSWRIYYSRK
ncbi:ATP-binding cassette sub-family G member 4 [Monomorium pharaonis]|uniref:ATP-binding cassette sub-family G member 4 n=1 Tax=Monomorium pharaonis TaxID=307658 RepID=UPI0017469FF5|nr:ATP-binding cassette sub-family G member 4 [Monomorium pharaonis]